MKNNTDLLKLPVVLLPLLVSVYVAVIYFLDMRTNKLNRKDLIKQAVVVAILLGVVMFLNQEAREEAIFTSPAPF